jgi:hypothetical protein
VPKFFRRWGLQVPTQAQAKNRLQPLKKPHRCNFAVTDPKQVSSIVEKFPAKHGPSDVKKYYSKFDVAVLADL